MRFLKTDFIIIDFVPKINRFFEESLIMKEKIRKKSKKLLTSGDKMCYNVSTSAKGLFLCARFLKKQHGETMLPAPPEREGACFWEGGTRTPSGVK